MAGHINLKERIKIKALHNQGFNVPAISKYLERHKTSIYRELSKRNDLGVYDHQYAQQLSSSNMARHRHQGPDDKLNSGPRRILKFLTHQEFNAKMKSKAKLRQ